MIFFSFLSLQFVDLLESCPMLNRQWSFLICDGVLPAIPICFDQRLPVSP
jgi:hypothetical protein